MITNLLLAGAVAFVPLYMVYLLIKFIVVMCLSKYMERKTEEKVQYILKKKEEELRERRKNWL